MTGLLGSWEEESREEAAGWKTMGPEENPPRAGKDKEARRRMTPFSKKPSTMAEVEIKSWKHKPYTSPASHSDQVL